MIGKYKLDKNAWIVVGGAAAAVSAAVLLFRGNGSSSPGSLVGQDLYGGVAGGDLGNEIDRLNEILGNLSHPTTSPIDPGPMPQGTPPPAQLGTPIPPVVVRSPAADVPVADLPPTPSDRRVLQYAGGGIEAGPGYEPLLSELAGSVARDFARQQPPIREGTEIHLVTGEIFRVAATGGGTVAGQVT